MKRLIEGDYIFVEVPNFMQCIFMEISKAIAVDLVYEVHCWGEFSSK